jgi:penicillin amidase
MQRSFRQAILFLLIDVFSHHFAYSQSTQTLHVKGLDSVVEIIRDKWGMNHIYARDEHDLFFTQGYCAAKDRLFQFEIWRRQATGTLAEILGASELKRDIGARLFAYRGDMRKELEHYHPRGKSIVGAFTDGVNAYIEQANGHPEQLPEEFRILRIKPEKWTPQVVISRHQAILGNVLQELNIGRAVTRVGEKQVKDLMWFHPKDPMITLDSTMNRSLLFDNILELYAAYHQNVQFEKPDSSHMTTVLRTEYPETAEATSAYFDQRAEGSNNWIISGRRTASGFPMLANDPHRIVAMPSLRYLVHLVAPGWNVIGAGEPEIPGVSGGHNEFGAWGFTISGTDGEDLYEYELNPLNLDQYRYQGGWNDMMKIPDTILVKNKKPVLINLRYTRHGPVVYIDSAHHTAYAVRSASLEPGGAPYLSELRVDQAKNWEEFRTACSYINIPALNMVWADKQGNIGWQVVGISPIRKNFSGLVPEPGDGRYEWDGFLPILEKPHLLNPSKGFFATANQSLTPVDYTHWDANGFIWSDNFRGDRINEVLAGQDKMDIKKMAALQTDYLSIPAREIVPLLRPIEFDSGMTNQAKTQLMRWDFTLNKESIAAAIYVMWEHILLKEANKLFVPEDIRGLLTIQPTKLISWLQKPEIIFAQPYTESRDLYLKATFKLAVDSLRRKLGDSLNRWQYGQFHFKHVQFIHALAGFYEERTKEKMNTKSIDRGGDNYTVCATSDVDNQNYGATYRQLADTQDWDKTLMCNSPGQSGNPESPFYKNLFEIWANDAYFPAYYSPQKINSVAVERIILKP